MKSRSGAIFSTALIAGTFDLLAAILVYAVILQKTTAIRILQSIASGVFEKEAYTGGSQMALYGVLFHYFIALCFTYFYFSVYPSLAFLKKNVVLSGVLYGLFVWIIMNLIVLPVAFPVLPEKHLDFPLLLSMLILIICIGFPISYRARNYYSLQL